MEDTVFVLPLPIDRRWRGAEMDRQDAVDHLQEGTFGLPRFVSRGAVGDGVAQRPRAFPELLLQDGVHAHGVR